MLIVASNGCSRFSSSMVFYADLDECARRRPLVQAADCKRLVVAHTEHRFLRRMLAALWRRLNGKLTLMEQAFGRTPPRVGLPHDDRCVAGFFVGHALRGGGRHPQGVSQPRRSGSLLEYNSHTRWRAGGCERNF